MCVCVYVYIYIYVCVCVCMADSVLLCSRNEHNIVKQLDSNFRKIHCHYKVHNLKRPKKIAFNNLKGAQSTRDQSKLPIYKVTAK